MTGVQEEVGVSVTVKDGVMVNEWVGVEDLVGDEVDDGVWLEGVLVAVSVTVTRMVTGWVMVTGAVGDSDFLQDEAVVKVRIMNIRKTRVFRMVCLSNC